MKHCYALLVTGSTSKKSTCGIAALLFSFSGDDPGEGVVVTLLFTYTHVRYSKDLFGEPGDDLQFSERGIATFLLATLQHICDLFKADHKYAAKWREEMWRSLSQKIVGHLLVHQRFPCCT